MPVAPQDRRLAKGRGATDARASARFDDLRREPDGDWLDAATDIDGDPPPVRTEVTMERPRTIIACNTSPDVPFDRAINPYRGCEHGCVYCFARPTHAFHNLSPGLDFETKLFVKPDAARLLRAELSRRGYVPATIAMGTNTDPYQPIEERYALMREILEVLAEFAHPVSILTKSNRILRDLDLLAPMSPTPVRGRSITSRSACPTKSRRSSRTGSASTFPIAPPTSSVSSARCATAATMIPHSAAA